MKAHGDLSVEMWSIGRLKPYAKNPRNNDTAVAAVAESIKRYGFRQPIVVDKEGTIIVGHTRWKAAKALGLANVPVHVADLPPKQAREYRIADNKTNELAAWDMPALRVEMKDLDLAWLDETSPTKEEQEDPGPQIDKAAELQKKWGTKTGQLWVLGDHRLLCGDSTKEEDVGMVLGEDKISVIATDPPYGIDYSEIVKSRTNQKAGGWDAIAGDVGQDGPCLTRSALTAAREHAAPGCAILCWHPSGENAGPFWDALVGAGVHVLKQIIWVKPALVFGRHEYHWRHEPAMYGWYDGSRANFYGDRSATTVWEVAPSPQYKTRNGPAMKSGGLGLHPTQKPVELYSIPYRNHSRAGDVAYEPFSGSGSGIVACEQLGRKCRAIEISPAYVAVAIQRWADMTGGRPKLAPGYAAKTKQKRR